MKPKARIVILVITIVAVVITIGLLGWLIYL